MVKRLTKDDIDAAEDVGVDDINVRYSDVSEAQKDIDDELQGILHEFGGTEDDTHFKIHVYRAIKDKGELEKCFSCTPAELPVEDRIIEEFGPGTYTVWIYKNKVRFKRFIVRIAEPRKKPWSAPPTQDVNSLVQTLLESQQNQMNEFKQLLLSVNQNPAPVQQSFNPMEMMGGMMGMMVQMKDFVNGGSESNKMSDILQAVQLVKEIGGGDAGGEGRNFMDGMVDLAKSFGPSLLDITSKLSAQSAAQVPRSTGTGPAIPLSGEKNPAPRIANENPEAGGNEQMTNQSAEMQRLKINLELLVMQARSNSDPALYADLVMDNTPAEQLAQWAAREDILPYLASIEPRINNHLDWFTSLLGEIKAGLGLTPEPSSDNNAENIPDQPPPSDAVTETSNEKTD